MKSQIVLGLSVVLSVFEAGSARADLPPDQTIQWRFRENPRDPNSAITLEAIVTLTAWEADGHAVGWSVARIEFRKPAGSGFKTWVEENPPLDTPDGLWWVIHIDPGSPNLMELLDTPRLRGRAFADDPGEEDIAYDLSARTRIGLTAFEHTTEISYALAAADTEEPIRDGDDEPVETHSNEDVD